MGIYLDKDFNHISRSSAMQQLHRQPLKWRCTHLLQGAPTSVPNVIPPCHHNFSIPSYQSENEWDLSFARIYSFASHSRLSLDMISSLIFINRHSIITPPEKYIDIFKGSSYHIQYKIDDMESSVDWSKKPNYED